MPARRPSLLAIVVLGAALGALTTFSVLFVLNNVADTLRPILYGPQQ